MAYKKKTWAEKLHDSKDLPKIVKLDNKAAQKWGGKTMYIPSPIEVDKAMKKVPKGKLVSINDLREYFSKKHKTAIACPLTSGIFARISAEAAEEEKEKGKKNTTPYWRTLKGKGEINPKYPGGELAQKKLLEAEGHKVIKKGKKYLVTDYQKVLYKF